MQLVLWNLRKNVMNLTQQDIADYLGITVQAYRDKEKSKNEFTQDEMFALSELFDRPIDKIFSPREHQIGNK